MIWSCFLCKIYWCIAHHQRSINRAILIKNLISAMKLNLGGRLLSTRQQPQTYSKNKLRLGSKNEGACFLANLLTLFIKDFKIVSLSAEPS